VRLDLKKKKEERKKLPLITLAEEGILTKLAYTRAKSTIRHIISTNFDTLPSPGVNPLEGSPKCSCGKRDSKGRSRLSTLERGRRSSWEPMD